VLGAECYCEFCFLEKVCSVGFLAHVVEDGPLKLCITGCCMSCWLLDGCLWGLIGKALYMMFSIALI
jgi:hypothetical protein